MTKLTSRTAYRLAVAVALAASALLVWLSLGVGIIGRDGDPANRLYFGVIAIGVVGAAIARLRSRGMAWVLAAMAAATALIAVIALVAGWGRPYSGPAELILLNGFFVAAFTASAWLFRQAEQRAEKP